MFDYSLSVLRELINGFIFCSTIAPTITRSLIYNAHWSKANVCVLCVLRISLSNSARVHPTKRVCAKFVSAHLDCEDGGEKNNTAFGAVVNYVHFVKDGNIFKNCGTHIAENTQGETDTTQTPAEHTKPMVSDLSWLLRAKDIARLCTRSSGTTHTKKNSTTTPGARAIWCAE